MRGNDWSTCRSQLFIPANRPSFISGAARYRPDAFILDLEDSVPASEREHARDALATAVYILSSHRPVSIRVNKEFETLVRDLDSAILARPAAIVLPKVESPVEVAVIAALVAEREIRNGWEVGEIGLQILVETAKGLSSAMSIALSSPRIVSMTLGVEDLAAELELDPEGVDFDVAWAHANVLLASRSAGIAPLGLLNSLSNFSDLDLFAKDVQQSSAFGFSGAFCVHPSQVPILNREFAPSAREVEKATRIVAALEKAERDGSASVALEGRMIDVPVGLRARRVLRRARLMEDVDNEQSGETGVPGDIELQ
jgi:citrate lyase subunit beta / citryl-CoA lyase